MPIAKNRGIRRYNRRSHGPTVETISHNPKKIFFLIGTNDLKSLSDELIILKYPELLEEAINIAPKSKIYVQSILPAAIA